MLKNRNKPWLSLLLVLMAVQTGLAGQSAPALVHKAQDALESEKTYDAIELFRQALVENPGYLEAYIGLARAFYYLDEYDEALRQVQAGLKYGHDSTGLFNIQGRILLALGKPDEAAKIFRLILKKEPYNVDSLMGLGEFSLLKGNEGDALANYSASLQYNPRDRRILLSLALLYEARGDRQKAEKHLLEAVDAYPDHPLVQVMAARFYLDRGEYAQTEFHAQTALSLSPDYAQALDVLGRLYLAKGEDRKVLASMSQLLGLEQENANAWYLSAVAHLRLGEVQPGMDALNRVLALHPADEIARIVLEDAAVRNLKPEDTQRSDLASWHFEQAALYRKKNMNERAEYHFQRGLYLAPLDVQGRTAWARYLKDAKRKASFVQELEALKKLGVSTTFVNDNLEIYKSLLAGTVADDWKVNQFLQETQPLTMRLFWIPSEQQTEHPLCEPVIARYFQALVSRSTKTSFRAGKSELDPDMAPRMVSGNAEAFNLARTEKTDYYLIMKFSDTGDDFAFTAGLYLSRTGKAMEEPRSWRTGNFRVQNAVVNTASIIQRILPARGVIIKRKLNDALVNLGTADGIKADTELFVLSQDAYVLNSAQPGFIFDKKDLLGTLKVGKTDERLAQGILKKEGFYDRMNTGDTVLFPGETVASARDSILSFPYLYNRIRMIH